MSEESKPSRVPAPGWYPQPDGRSRYWDGRDWTENYTAAPESREPDSHGWTPWKIISTVVGVVVVAIFGGVWALRQTGVLATDYQTTKAEAVEICKDFADDDLQYPDEAQLLRTSAESRGVDSYTVRGYYNVHGGSGPLRCEVNYQQDDQNWYLQALTEPEENGGADQGVTPPS